MNEWLWFGVTVFLGIGLLLSCSWAIYCYKKYEELKPKEEYRLIYRCRVEHDAVLEVRRAKNEWSQVFYREDSPNCFSVWAKGWIGGGFD